MDDSVKQLFNVAVDQHKRYAGRKYYYLIFLLLSFSGILAILSFSVYKVFVWLENF